MKDFSTISNTSGTFPNVVSQDSSGPTLRDGTPMTSVVVNDIWGAFQAILNTAGTTPSGAAEIATASDLLDSIRKVGGTPGELVFYATPTETIDANILPLKGQVISIASYPALVAATYVGDSYNSVWTTFIKTSDAAGTTPSTSGTYFVLPDCRGQFIRSLANTKTGVDAGRDYLQLSSGDNWRSASGEGISESPGQHKHYLQTVDPIGLGFEKEVQYAMLSDPGSVEGTSATVPTYSRTAYKVSSTEYDLETKIGYNGGQDYSQDFYGEVRPSHVAFQLGIRY